MKGKMRAAILYAYNSPLKLEEVDIPQIGPGEALVKVKACGLCHTDLSLIEGNARNLPHSLGHEGAGDVVEVGEGVTDLKVGDRVCISLRFVCGDCLYCRTGRDNLCANLDRSLRLQRGRRLRRLCEGSCTRHLQASAKRRLRGGWDNG